MLRVIRREENGYHYLQTVFQFTDLFDEIGFEVREDNEIRFNYEHLDFSKEEDLIYRAITALKHYSNSDKGVTIDLIKNLPMGAGIGGGSSNAATTLVALNALWELNLSQTALIEIGKKIGADVPIFIYGKSAWAEGIGEILTPLEIKEEEFTLINPGIHISTKLIFESSELPRNSMLFPDKYFDQSRAINDCLPAIYHHYPAMRLIMNALNELNLNPYITGTGSCIFVPKMDAEQSLLLSSLAKEQGWELLPFKSLNQSLLYENAPIAL
ncbi:4-(cytidine 5'-diphospho)-2-C-methyl-D-erythritol kinase [Ignatzschineria rhizosphaerae]|uniref:4-diphosphocytidyl-2-C-methyl-D-erythritol kinase n=2 Tax=Ignatzschineria rhizosphaerae TaxID=2923279 RepID=A0ABY3X4F3_9GAMM|nr:4-(cytidine 5'-diphospho)-2-C-methyl-D-erythritol kinase [Ignatzschineria rhizosphaerae]